MNILSALDIRVHILSKRENTLREYWHKSTDQSKRDRAIKLSVVIQREISSLHSVYLKEVDRQRREQYELENSIVDSSCKIWGCPHMSMPSKQYYEKEHFCPNGHRLYTKGEWKMKIESMRMGVKM